MNPEKRIGFSCAYTPLAVIHAAGFTPYRILPDENSEDRAGQLLHDNLCPHVKRILDRAMGGALPELEGMVFMNSCDAMRRLYDAWKTVRPEVNAVLIDLPVTAGGRSVAFFQDEIARLATVLEAWGGKTVDHDSLADSVGLYNRLAADFEQVRKRVKNGDLDAGPVELQAAYNTASCTDPDSAHAELEALLARPLSEAPKDKVPVHVFGNMLPDPEAFALFESCGARVVAEDMCTGSRLFTRMTANKDTDILEHLAGHILNRPPCARTFDDARPGRLARDVVSQAVANGARGVIGYTAKFCDPYIARLPSVRDALKKEGLPFLALEGDLTLRSMGQQKTRIQAFIEMLR